MPEILRAPPILRLAFYILVCAGVASADGVAVGAASTVSVAAKEGGGAGLPAPVLALSLGVAGVVLVGFTVLSLTSPITRKLSQRAKLIDGLIVASSLSTEAAASELNDLKACADFYYNSDFDVVDPKTAASDRRLSHVPNLDRILFGNDFDADSDAGLDFELDLELEGRDQASPALTGRGVSDVDANSTFAEEELEDFMLTYEMDDDMLVEGEEAVVASIHRASIISLGLLPNAASTLASVAIDIHEHPAEEIEQEQGQRQERKEEV